MFDYLTSGNYPNLKPRSLHRAMNAEIGRDGKLFAVAIPSSQGLSDVGGNLTKVDKDISFYDFAIVPAAQDKFESWLDEYHGSLNSVSTYSDEQLLDMAVNNPTAYAAYLDSRNRTKSSKGKRSGKPTLKDLRASHSDLIESGDKDEIAERITLLESLVSGKDAFRGENRKSAQKMLDELKALE